VSIWTTSPDFSKVTRLGFHGVGGAFLALFWRQPCGSGRQRLNRSAPDERADDAPDDGVGCGVALFAQDLAELFLAPHRRIEAQVSTAAAKPSGRRDWRTRRGRRLKGAARFCLR
jgi:hypothetical protein